MRLLRLEFNCLEAGIQVVQNIYCKFSLDFHFPSFSGQPKDWERWHGALCKAGSRWKVMGFVLGCCVVRCFWSKTGRVEGAACSCLLWGVPWLRGRLEFGYPGHHWREVLSRDTLLSNPNRCRASEPEVSYPPTPRL